MRTADAAVPGDQTVLLDRYVAVRAQSMALASPLSEADCQAQSMPDASPIKWHLAHTTWFFETFILEPHEPGFRPHHPAFRVLFNSYYNGVGDQHPRSQRGLVTRPSLAEVRAYRLAVDERIVAVVGQAAGPALSTLLPLLELGLQHEQQHQELMLTDVRHLFSCNPLQPVYRAGWPATPTDAQPLRWIGFDGGLVDIGHGGSGFAFDNEGPRHRVWLQPYALADRLVTHGEWRDFIADGGYREPRWWLSAGWDWVRSAGVAAPLYWRQAGAAGAEGSCFTLHGQVLLDPQTPVANVSCFEADAYARWTSAQHPGQRPARLPTEAEWEHAAEADAGRLLAQGHFVESQALHPLPACTRHGAMQQLLGDLWEWTSSAYAPYPGFSAWGGAVGEYNAKFMVNQMVLRGGSCATPRSHIRTSYRNFFPAETRWQFSGVRLARDLA